MTRTFCSVFILVSLWCATAQTQMQEQAQNDEQHDMAPVVYGSLLVHETYKLQPIYVQKGRNVKCSIIASKIVPAEQDQNVVVVSLMLSQSVGNSERTG